VAEGEGIEAPEQALSLVARAARGSFRDAVSTFDQFAAATEVKVTVQAVLQLLGAVEEEALFRLCDLVVDRDTAGALTFVEGFSPCRASRRSARNPSAACWRPSRVPSSARNRPRSGRKIGPWQR
jgi:DNA polymerase III gamma/tau subunit